MFYINVTTGLAGYKCMCIYLCTDLTLSDFHYRFTIWFSWDNIHRNWRAFEHVTWRQHKQQVCWSAGFHEGKFRNGHNSREFPTWKEDKLKTGQEETEWLFRKSCVEFWWPFLSLRCLLFAAPWTDWLQVHAIDEVIWLLRGEGSRLLKLVTDKSETTANHEQEQSSDD